MRLEEKIFESSGRFTARYVFHNEPKSDHLFLLLHGYSLTGEHFAKKISDVIPKNVSWLSPHAPFPVPQHLENGMRIGYSWYFYEAGHDEYYIDMKLAENYLVTLLNELKLSDQKKTIIGYSQGGYLAPFVAQKLTNVERVIGLSCHFLNDEIQGSLPKYMDQIHGTEDDVVEIGPAQESFKKLITRGVAGKFISVPKIGHGLDSAIVEKLGDLLKGKNPTITST